MFKKGNIFGILKSANINLKYLPAFFGIWIIFTACDPCSITNSGGSGQGNLQVVFSSVPINSQVPGIFTINEQGSDLREIISNGLIFSPPSITGRIAYLSYDEEFDSNVLMSTDMNGNNTMELARSSQSLGISYPVISPDGNYIAFNDGIRNRLMFIDFNNLSVLNRVSSNLYLQSISAFSNNSKMIAFFETVQGESDALLLKIVDLNITDFPYKFEEIVKLKFDGIDLNSQKDLTINWSLDNQSVTFALKTGSESNIYIVALNGNKTEIPLGSLGGSMPDISPDGNYIAFTSLSGDLYIRQIEDGEGFIQLDTLELNEFARWSEDSKTVLYSKYYSDETQNTYSTLFSINIDNRQRNVLSNNVLRGFWGNKQ